MSTVNPPEPICKLCGGWGFLTRAGFPYPGAPYDDGEHARPYTCRQPGCAGRVREVPSGARIPTPAEALLELDQRLASDAMAAAEAQHDRLEDR